MRPATENMVIVLSIVATLFISCYFAFIMKDYTSDDALIYYRYIQNCLDGKGLVYNVGERFNGLTSPLYTYLSLGTAALFQNILYTQIGLGALFLFLTSVMLIPLLKDDLPSPLLIVLPPLLASSVFFYKTFGLETMLFLFLTVLALLLYIKQKYFLLSVISTLLLLTRGESIFLLFTLLFFHFRDRRGTLSFKLLFVPAGILGIHFIFMYLYYGSFLPHTLTAKIAQGKSGCWGRFAFLHHSQFFFEWYFGQSFWLISLLAATAVMGLYSIAKSRLIMIMTIFLTLYCMFYIVLNIPDYFWYYGYLFLMLYIFFVLGMKTLYRIFAAMKNSKLRKTGYGIITAVFMFVFLKQLTISHANLNNAHGQTEYITIGKWIETNTEPNAKIACIEIGHIGWYSKRYIIDILGLVNPYNAEFIGKRKFDEWLKYYTPDYILVWVPLRPHERSVKKLLAAKQYTVFHEFDFSGWKFQLLKKTS